MKVLVTGASGFLGASVCADLITHGHEVVSLVRRPGSEPEATTPVSGDLADAPSLATAVNSTVPDCVIHLAAEIASQRDPQKIEAANVAGTRRLLEACAGLPTPPRFVFTSTVVTGDANGKLLTEASVLPVQTPYGASKQAGETMVRESGLDAVIIRPSHVYGPGGWYAQEIVPRVRQWPRAVVMGSGTNLWDVVHVADVARACVLAAERGPAGATYHVADDEPITQYDFLALTAQALGVGAPRRVPTWVAGLAAGRDTVVSVTRSARSSNAKIKRELSWVPAYPTAQTGVPAAVAALS